MNPEETASVASYIHYNPERVDYTVTRDELLRLGQSGQNHWKDFGLVSFSVGFPCILNGISATGYPFSYDFSNINIAIFLNYLFGLIGIILGIVFIIAWQKTATDFRSIIRDIENKPKILLIAPSSGGTGQVLKLPSQENR